MIARSGHWWRFLRDGRWANTRALSFESVVFGVRTQPLLTFRKALLPLDPIESNFKSASLYGLKTSELRKTENGYEEGSFRGAFQNWFNTEPIW